MPDERREELTLADIVLRESLRNAKKRQIEPYIGERVKEARRFVLDDGASSFLCDLSHANFHGTRRRTLKALDHSRILARLPHNPTWVEYDNGAYQARLLDAYILPKKSAEWHARRRDLGEGDISIRTGWLLSQKPGNETQFLAEIFGQAGSKALWLPFCYCWSATDDPLDIPKSMYDSASEADRTLQQFSADLALGFKDHGLGWNDRNTIGVFRNDNKTGDKQWRVTAVKEWTGELRRVFSFLAAVNDIPMGVRKVEPSRGFVARGSYHRLLEHKVITLMLPKGRDPQKAARAVIAMARRRAHQVRGHWRRDWRHEGNRLWIHEHWRGDAKLGVVIHDYKVEHGEGGVQPES
jgi:hypothetical protein